MTNQHEIAQIEWREDVIPIATKFDDPYYSLNDGMTEARHVFLTGNNLPNRFCDGFKIAELGFGTGLNLLVAWKEWIDAGHKTQLSFTSFEAFPISLKDMNKALQPFKELQPLANILMDQLKDGWTIQTPNLCANIITGDARLCLPKWSGSVDAWFLDGFSPAKNPELWGAELMQEVAKHTNTNGTVATFTAAGHVRSKLTDAGFEVERIAGFGRKRHMTIGRMP